VTCSPGARALRAINRLLALLDSPPHPVVFFCYDPGSDLHSLQAWSSTVFLVFFGLPFIYLPTSVLFLLEIIEDLAFFGRLITLIPSHEPALNSRSLFPPGVSTSVFLHTFFP